MFEFFDWVISTVSSLLNFVWQTINGLLRLLGLIPVATNALTSSVAYLPSILATFAATTITISVIFVIAGRSGGGQK